MNCSLLHDLNMKKLSGIPMRHSHLFGVSLLSIGLISPVFAQDLAAQAETPKVDTQNAINSEESSKVSPLQAIKELKNIKASQLKVNAKATQPEEVKDPLQPLNRQVYEFNDFLDRNILRPAAVQYKEKTPEPVRNSYRAFRDNLGEPWNAVNQLIQGRPARAAKTLGRFSINTLTSLGFADPARRLGLPAEDENFGTTLGYYGISSGPFVMLPFLGPSTFRDGIGFVIDRQARPQSYLLEDDQGLLWTDNVLGAVDLRSRLLDAESVLQGDKYAIIRDIYLQRKHFEISQKKGVPLEEIAFQEEDDIEMDDEPEQQEEFSPSTEE